MTKKILIYHMLPEIRNALKNSLVGEGLEVDVVDALNENAEKEIDSRLKKIKYDILYVGEGPAIYPSGLSGIDICDLIEKIMYRSKGNPKFEFIEYPLNEYGLLREVFRSWTEGFSKQDTKEAMNPYYSNTTIEDAKNIQKLGDFIKQLTVDKDLKMQAAKDFLHSVEKMIFSIPYGMSHKRLIELKEMGVRITLLEPKIPKDLAKLIQNGK